MPTTPRSPRIPTPLIHAVLSACLVVSAAGAARAAAAPHRTAADIVLLASSGARPALESRGFVDLDFGVARRGVAGRTWTTLEGVTVDVVVSVDHRVWREERVTPSSIASLDGVRDRIGMLRGSCSRGRVHVPLPDLAGAHGVTVDLRLAGTDSTLGVRRRVVFGLADRSLARRAPAPAAPDAAGGCVESIVDDVRADFGVTVAQAMHPDGWPRVAYYAMNDDLDYVVGYASQGPGGWTIETADSSATTDIGENCDMAIDASGVSNVSYWDFDNLNLRYARRATNGTWSRQTVTSSQDVGEYNSIALDPAGLPRIAFSYVNSTTFVSQLRLASRSSGGSWSASEVVDNTADVGYWCSLAIDATGRPHVAYYDFDNGTLKYAVRNGSTWTVEIADDTEFDQGESASLALDASGNPCVAYLGGADGHLMYAHRVGGSWTHADIDLATVPGASISLAIGADGRAIVAYVDATDGRVLMARQQAGGAWGVVAATDPGSAAGPVQLSATAGATRLAYLDDTGGAISMRALTCGATLDVPAPAAAQGEHSLRVWPTPVRGGSLEIAFGANANAEAVRSVTILDVAGRVARRFDAASTSFASGRLTWDGLDEHGARVRPGMYFVEARSASGRMLQRVSVVQ